MRCNASTVSALAVLGEMTVGELEAELSLVWRSDWHHPKTMTRGELESEVARVWSKGMQR